MRLGAAWSVQGRPATRSDAALRPCERGLRSADALRNTKTRSFTGQYLEPMLERAQAAKAVARKKTHASKEAVG